MEGIIQGVGGFVGGVQEFLNEFELWYTSQGDLMIL